MGRTVVRPNLQRGLEMRNCAVQVAALQEEKAEILIRHVIVTGNSQCVVP